MLPDAIIANCTQLREIVLEFEWEPSGDRLQRLLWYEAWTWLFDVVHALSEDSDIRLLRIDLARVVDETASAIGYQPPLTPSDATPGKFDYLEIEQLPSGQFIDVATEEPWTLYREPLRKLERLEFVLPKSSPFVPENFPQCQMAAIMDQITAEFPGVPEGCIGIECGMWSCSWVNGIDPNVNETDTVPPRS